AVLIHSMMLGVKALNFSASVVFEDQLGEQAAPRPQAAAHAVAATGALMTTSHAIESPEQAIKQKTAERAPISASSNASAGATAAGSVAFMLIFNVLIFIALPLLITNFLFIYFGWGNAPRISFEHLAGASSGAPWYQEAWMWLQAYIKPVRPSVAFNL